MKNKRVKRNKKYKQLDVPFYRLLREPTGKVFNEETQRVIRDVEEGKNLSRVYSSFEEILKELDIEINNFSKGKKNRTMKKKEIPNEKTINALNEYEAMKKDKVHYKRYSSFAEAVKDLEK